jgi:ribosomal-protein-alanine N-acetyltransferase
VRIEENHVTRKSNSGRPELTLAPLRQEHAAATLRWMSDPDVRRNLSPRNVPEPESTVSWIGRALADETVRPFAILHGERHVGNVVLDKLDSQMGAARLSIYIGDPADRGKGLGRGAMRLACGEAFGKLGLLKIWATVHVRNPSSVAALCSAGFSLEGIHREEFILDGERVAVFYLGLTREDFLRPQPGP